jgi:SAM-dependent methyltransferase
MAAPALRAKDWNDHVQDLKLMAESAGFRDLRDRIIGLAAPRPGDSVLDVGAGTGLWRGWFAAERPRVAYRSVDVSDYACRRYGHEQADISRWRPDTPSDLVVCQGVLQYLDDEACSRAVGNLAAACSALLYLEVPTAGDLRDVIDTDATDLDIYWRTGSWYRRRLGRHFRAIGGGLYAARAAGLHFYELETVGPPHATAAR